MACVAQFTCPECRLDRREIVVTSRVCVACRTAKAAAQESAHMQFLAALPPEERLRRIELALYRLSPETRLKAIEAAHNRYG